MSRAAWTLVLLTFAAISAIGQQCPQQTAKNPDIESQSRVLEGELVFHDGLRRWFELKLDHPQCGQSSVELVRPVGSYAPVEVLRGCRVKSKGRIGFSLTGYYSLETYQDVEEIEPAGTCARQPVFPDYSKVKPDRDIRQYRVEMLVNYAAPDHPIHFRVTSEGKELRPWQAYASYQLTGGFVLYGLCGDGFRVAKVFGAPDASPSHFLAEGEPGDMAAFDPEGAAAQGAKILRLGYTCVRTP